jgi:hypothetical protein
MNMKEMSWLCLLPLLCVDCGPAEAWEEGTRTATSSYVGRTASLSQPLACVPDELPSLDNIPEAPLSLLDWPWSTHQRFVEAGVLSAYVLVSEHPDDPTRFLAHGFDVRAQKMLFYVQAPKSRFLEAFTAQVQSDFVDIRLHAPEAASSSPLVVDLLGRGDEVPPINPPGPPDINDPLRRRLLAHYQVAVRMDLVSQAGKVQRQGEGVSPRTGR